MAVETRTNQSLNTYILKGSARYHEEDGVQGFGASGRDTDGDMVKGTVMCRNANGRLVPLTSLTANDGTSIPVGLLHCTLSEAELEAKTTGQTVPCLLLDFAEGYNEDLVVFDGASPSIDLEDIVSTTLTDESLHRGTVRELLQKVGITFLKSTDVSGYES